MTKFIMVVGLPGAGKSTYIAKNFIGPDFVICSSDVIRAEIGTSENDQTVNDQVFNLLHQRVKEALLQNKTVIYDATNINRKRRKAFLQEISKIVCIKECHLIATPYEICLKQNKKRYRQVPEEVIRRMCLNFNVPFYNEGWDNIRIIYPKRRYQYYYGNWTKFIKRYLDFDQETPWHNTTVGNHCLKACQYVLTQDGSSPIRTETIIAAALHDCGKPFAKTFTSTKGEPSEVAHYYGHENAGAYFSLFYKKAKDVNDLAVAALINYHMAMHDYKTPSEKAKRKLENSLTSDTRLITMDFWSALKILHEADLAGHD